MSRALGIALALLLGASTADAEQDEVSFAEIEGVRFVDRIEADDLDLRLHDTALLRKYLLKGYVAALYLGPDLRPDAVLSDGAKRLEIEYFWDISGSDFAKASDEWVAKNVDEDTLARLRPQLDRMNALYRDVRAGDRYAITYVPERGTELALNGSPLGVVEGADFARAIFSIWLGEVPLDRGFKRRILDGS